MATPPLVFVIMLRLSPDKLIHRVGNRTMGIGLGTIGTMHWQSYCGQTNLMDPSITRDRWDYGPRQIEIRVGDLCPVCFDTTDYPYPEEAVSVSAGSDTIF